MALSAEIRRLLRCPACSGELADGPDRHECRSCGNAYPVVDGVPVLIDEKRSIFDLADYVERDRLLVPEGASGNGKRPLHWVRDAIYDILPDPNVNLSARGNYARLAALLGPGLRERPGPARVLVVGGREVGRGMLELLENESIELVETDIDFGPRTELVADGHQLPFADGSFQAVIAQAVLEHVLDPVRCVEEIHRVLAPGGIVYAETPFLQRRHGGRFDFTRFTFLGHRRLFRHFEKIDAGTAVGPGVALAWQYNGWLLSFSDRRWVRAGLRVLGRLTSFWLKWLDPILAKNEAAIDSASGFYFLGARSDAVLSDRELLGEFRGIE